MGAVKGLAYMASVAFARPNNVTAYVAGQVLGPLTTAGGAVLQFPNIGPSGTDCVMITTGEMEYDAASIPAGMTSFRCHLYKASPASNLGDGGVWDLSAADRVNYLGYVDLGSPLLAGASTLYIQSTFLNKQFRMPGTAGGVLFSYLVTNGGFTPAANTTLKASLHSIGLGVPD